MASRSTACQTCKDRRIKCDGTKPVCQRCIKSKRQCIDSTIAKQACFSIHIENRYASGKIHRPRGPRSSLTVFRPQFDLPTRAIAYYTHSHLHLVQDLPPFMQSLAECVAKWHTSKRQSPMVDLALSSMALAVFSQTHRYKPTAIEASRRYQSLLGIVQARIGQVGRCISNEADLDACLLAIFFMARYETVMFWPTEHFSPVSLALMQDWSHHDGAMAVLKTWFHSSDRKPATFLVKHTRRGLVKCALLRNLPLPDWLLDGSPFGEVGLELGYDRLIVRVVNLHYDMKSLLACAEFNITEAETLNDEANRLLEELEDWVAKFPKAWSFRRHDFPNFGPWPRKHFFSPILYSFDKPAYGAAWALYFAAKILTSSISLRLLDFVHDDASSISLHRHQWLDSSQAFREAIESLAATVPCCLGVFTVCDSVNSEYNQSMTVASTEKPIPPHLANLLIWCLTLPSIIPVMEQRQQAWFRSELAELGRLTGTGILQTAETGQWGSL